MSTLAHALAFAGSALHTGRRRDRGATAVEYALVIVLVSLVVVGAVAAFQGKVDDLVSGVTFS